MKHLLADPGFRQWTFVAVKYLVYGVLAWNGYQFFLAEHQAQATTFIDGVPLAQIGEVYSGSIDSAFWILLVVLLELETYVVDDATLRKPAVKWGMIGARSLCYGMIVYALYGYVVKWLFQADIEPLAISDVCSLTGQGYSILLEFETYVPLTAQNCHTLAGVELGQLNGHDIVAPVSDLVYARNVAAIDVVNATAWLAIVALLEVDVWYQLKRAYTGWLYGTSMVVKVILYTILFACALAWGYTGVWLDIVDAVLWLFAFFFIEMNLFQWHEETRSQAAPADAGARA